MYKCLVEPPEVFAISSLAQVRCLLVFGQTMGVNSWLETLLETQMGLGLTTPPCHCPRSYHVALFVTHREPGDEARYALH